MATWSTDPLPTFSNIDLTSDEAAETKNPSPKSTASQPESNAKPASAVDRIAKAWKSTYFSDENFPEWTKSQSASITMPLTLPESKGRPIGLETTTKCLLCPRSFSVPSKADELVAHMTLEHFVIIDEPNLISDFPSYLDYYRNKLKQGITFSEFATPHTVEITSKDKSEATKGEVHILTDRRMEDRDLRKHLQMLRLESVLEVQEKERTDTSFDRSCLFCRQTFQNSAANLVNHMAHQHNFSIGHPSNLVFVNDFLDVIEKKMDACVCVYCEKTFKSRDIMKEHMRKKGHKKINPRNVNYDKYYIVNYLEFGRSWKEKDIDDAIDEEMPNGFISDDDDQGDENDWSDWRATGSGSGAICLFCPVNYLDVDQLLTHMTSIHDFDFNTVRNSKRLNFYQQVKLVNYIRRQFHLNSCICCLETFEDAESLNTHMTTKEHFKVPEDQSEWDQPEYFFPTYENDNLLHYLEEVGTGSSAAGKSGPGNPPEVPVYAEEFEIGDSVLLDQKYRESICPPANNRAKRGNQKQRGGRYE